jgi:LAS superfamily LD-carboxypeptidase LdcB
MLGPGLSDHQTGLALDFTDRSDLNAMYDEFEDGYMKDTELYQWLVEHCAEYGFILRYPEGKEEYYGTPCQHPAHFRYVGKEAAEYIMANNLCLEEFIMLYDESLVFLPKP